MAPLPASYTGFLFLHILLIFLTCCVIAQYDHSCPQTSSCGSLTTIKYPFRLKGDPSKCGDKNFELICENGQTPILYLFSGKYQVKAIDYTYLNIQLVDVGLQDGNCSSLPVHSINMGNFTSQFRYWLMSYENNLTVMYISCETPQKSYRYIDLSTCLTTKNKYSYVLLDSAASNIADSCVIDLMFPAFIGPENTTNVTYTELHKYLANGFVLSWSPSHCSDCKGQGTCIHYSLSSVVTCTDPCTFTYVSSPLCFLSLVAQIGWIIALGLYYAMLYPVLGLPISPIMILMIVRFICGGICVLVLLIYKWRRRHLSMYNPIEEFLRHNSDLMPIRYSHNQIKKMTDNFKTKLGEGGYGSVYKGKLRSGYFVAVKILGKSEATGQDFINEVATIGRIHHVNVVRLIGFCVEGSKRALVYDFMPNGSLDKYALRREGYHSLSCKKMYEISLGVARGIEYLHRGCEMQILHFDIKPHNILLDENFNPKISDFGLAKLYPTTNNTVSLTAARGTIGYIAPELFYKSIGSVSYKADVYSFGMLLMEIVGKREKLNTKAERSSQTYFPSWVHDQIVNEKEEEMGCTEEEKRTIKKMVIVALWCIQINPTNRPPMSKVLEMLEGNIESIQVPPSPCIYPQETWKIGEDEDTIHSWSPSATLEFTESASLIKTTALEMTDSGWSKLQQARTI